MANRFQKVKEKLFRDGYAILDRVYSDEEIERVISSIEAFDCSEESFRKSTHLEHV